MRKLILLSSMFFVLGGLLLAQENSISSLLPETKFYKKLKKEDVTKVYTNDDLFEIIDGGADIFLEYGFKNFIRTNYANKKVGSFMVEVYEMADPGAALGIFSILQVKEAVKVDIGAMGSLTDYFLAFFKGNYFVRISVPEKNAETRNDMQEIAKIIEMKINDQDMPNEVFATNLIADYNIQNSIYFRGNIAFSNTYFLHAKNIFNTGEGVYFKQDDFDFVILKYNSRTDAQSIVKRSRVELEKSSNDTDFQNFQNGYSYVNRKGNSIYVLSEKNLCFIILPKKNLSTAQITGIVYKNMALLERND